MSDTPTRKKRIALIGTGGRSGSFTHPIYRDFNDTTELVAMCDISDVRRKQRLMEMQEETGCPDVPLYHSDDFVKMLEETKPDDVIICTMDCTHDQYIDAALRAGFDVTTEKPMTTDAEKVRTILKAVKDSGHKVRVAFNYRWIPVKTKIKELISSGVIGQVRHVMVEYALNTSHGADYFRRWHSEKDKSGGLLVHKSTHHFDLVNWWTDSVPAEVYATGDLVFYGKENALKRGDDAYTKYDRYTGTESKEDPFRLDLTDHKYSVGMYMDAEAETGYIRDRNVFREGITIEDTMSVIVKYRNGMTLNYSLNAFSPKEGMRTIFHGDRGRLEYADFGGSHLILGQSEEELAEMQEKDKGFKEILLSKHFQPTESIDPPKATGSHGGGDAKIQEQVFLWDPPTDPWGRSAGHEQGTASVMIGIAANESMKTNQPVKILNLVPEFNSTATKLSELV